MFVPPVPSNVMVLPATPAPEESMSVSLPFIAKVLPHGRLAVVLVLPGEEYTPAVRAVVCGSELPVPFVMVNLSMTVPELD